MTTGVITPVDLLAPPIRGPEQTTTLVDGQAGDRTFDDVLEQFVEQTADVETRDQRLEALRSSIETMDDSEVVGFLAMLENQTQWQVERQPSADIVDIQSWQGQGQGQGLNQGETPVNQVLETRSQATLANAAAAGLEQALEQYIPPEETEQKAGALLKNELSDKLVSERTSTEVSRLIFGQPVSEEVTDQTQTFRSAAQPAFQTDMTMKLQMQVVTQATQETWTAPQSQSSIELLGAVPTAIDTTQVAQRIESAPVTTQSVVAQPTTQGNPEISLRQENWSDAMGQRLVAMLSDGRREAEIRLDPPELGTIGAKLVIEESRVSVQLVSATQQVRELLEGQSDRLRQALISQGHNQVDVNVGSDTGGQQARPSESRIIAGSGLQNDADYPLENAESLSVNEKATGIINAFA